MEPECREQAHHRSGISLGCYGQGVVLGRFTIGQGILAAAELGEAPFRQQALEIGDRMPRSRRSRGLRMPREAASSRIAASLGLSFSDSLLMSDLCRNSERCACSLAIKTHFGRVARENFHQMPRDKSLAKTNEKRWFLRVKCRAAQLAVRAQRTATLSSFHAPKVTASAARIGQSIKSRCLEQTIFLGR